MTADALEVLRQRYRERCSLELADLEALMVAGVRSGERLRNIAHGLSGSGGTFGFPALSEAAAVVDDALMEGRETKEAELQTLAAALRRIVN